MVSGKYLFIEEVNKFFDNLEKEVKKIKEISNKEESYKEAKKAFDKAWEDWNHQIMNAYSQYRNSDESIGVWQTIDLGFDNITGKSNSNLYKDLREIHIKAERERESKSKSRTQESPKENKPKPRPPKSKSWTQTIKEASLGGLEILTQEINNFANWLTGRDKQFICEWCKQNKSGQYWYIEGKEEKFCSESCINSWKEKIKIQIEEALKKLEEEQRKLKENEQKLKEITEYPCDGCNQKINLAYDHVFYKDVSEKKGYLCKLCHEKRNICSECRGQGQIYEHKTKNDGKKFCSSACFDKHYAPVCNNCSQKVLGDSYYNDSKDKTGTLCPNCYNKKQEMLKEMNESVNKVVREKKEQEINIQIALIDTGNYELNALLGKTRQQAQEIYGSNSPFYQEIVKQQEEVIPLLRSVSDSKRNKFLNLARQLKPFDEKVLRGEELNPEEQAYFLAIAKQMEELIIKLKEKQQKKAQLDQWKPYMIGGGIIGSLGLITFLVWLVNRKKK